MTRHILLIASLSALVAGLSLPAAAPAQESVATVAAATDSAAIQPITVDGSTLIGQLAYDPATSTLYVQMTFSTDWYGYAGVPAEEYAAFLAAESKGAFFNTHIRNHYPEQRWEP
ncbi:MAG: KTSC domain-containing protein [Kiritimatiellae bacterium]|nr:KTSC domain-containing protein [Kiritimatiellia bacterium]